MANIIQAAKWLDEDGRAVRRASLPDYIYHLDEDDYIVIAHPADARINLSYLSPTDLLADDWELALQIEAPQHKAGA